MRALFALTWLEIKIFVREPLGVFGTVGVPVLVFLALGRVAGPALARAAGPRGGALPAALPVLAAVLMMLSAVTSLVAIVAIYREGGILKRLRATPLPPLVILSAHVLVKLLFTGLTLVLLLLAGRRYFPAGIDPPVVSFGLAVLFSTWSVLSLGFLIASVVPTARFAQPVAGVLLYLMLAVSGLFFPVQALPPPMRHLASVLPLTYAVSLLNGVWVGAGWWAHLGDVAALIGLFLLFSAMASRVFRWE